MRFFLFVLVFSLHSCGSDTETKVKEVNTSNMDRNLYEDKEQLNNPALFLGSSFGEFMQMLHKTGDYEKMLIFTSNKTRNDYSDSVLIDFYRHFDFSYPLKLKAYNNDILLYQTAIGATNKTIQFPVLIEDDTCRIWFDTLNIHKPFIGM